MIGIHFSDPTALRVQDFATVERDASRDAANGKGNCMGTKNYLIEGVSGTGKTSVCDELRRRGYYSINGDTEFAYQGDPKTGEPLEGFTHEHHIWNVEKVRAMAADQSHAVSFFCGGSRNFSSFIDLFDLVFVLKVDQDTLTRRLADRPEAEWGGKPAERQLILRLHATKEDVPEGGVGIDATTPIECVVDEILKRCNQVSDTRCSRQTQQVDRSQD